jgi:hypothetical protein
MKKRFPLWLAFGLVGVGATIKLITDYPNSIPVDSDFLLLQRNSSYVSSAFSQVKTTLFTSPQFTGSGSIDGNFTAGAFFGDGSGLTGINGSGIPTLNGNGTNTSLWGQTFIVEVDADKFYPTNMFVLTNWPPAAPDTYGQCFLWNSNGTRYDVNSKVDALTWTKTNLISAP